MIPDDEELNELEIYDLINQKNDLINQLNSEQLDETQIQDINYKIQEIDNQIIFLMD